MYGVWEGKLVTLVIGTEAEDKWVNDMRNC